MLFAAIYEQKKILLPETAQLNSKKVSNKQEIMISIFKTKEEKQFFPSYNSNLLDLGAKFQA